MMHRIRQAFIDGTDDDEQMGGPIEADEFYVGGVEKWKHSKNKTGIKGGTKGKTAVVGMKDRTTNQITAKPIESVRASTLTRSAPSSIVARKMEACSIRTTQRLTRIS